MRATNLRRNKTTHKRTRGIILALGFGIAAIQAHSQSSIAPTATIVGYVIDQSGANVSKATVTLTEINKEGALLKTSSDDNGSFSIKAPIGDYVFVIASPGFASHKEVIHLPDETAIKKNIVLKVFTCGPCLTVSPISPIETYDASLTSTLTLNPLPPLKLNKRTAR